MSGRTGNAARTSPSRAGGSFGLRAPAGLLVACATLMLVACGQRGPLYLPDKKPQEEQTQQSAPAPQPAPSDTPSTAGESGTQESAPPGAATPGTTDEEDEQAPTGSTPAAGDSATPAQPAPSETPPREGPRGATRG